MLAILLILFKSFSFLFHKIFKIIWLSNSLTERFWWRSILWLSVSDEGQFSAWAFLMKVNSLTERFWWGSILWLSVSDEGQFSDWAFLMKVNSLTERFWWRLFQIWVVHTTLYVSIVFYLGKEWGLNGISFFGVILNYT